METLSIDVAVLLVGGGPVESRIAEAINLDFMSPNVSVECFEVVLVDKAKLEMLSAQVKRLLKDRQYVHLLERKGRL